MSSQASTKVRLVRCPKCREVLAELPEVLLYKCGGCGTVLQAKNTRREISTTKPSPQVTDSVPKGRQDDDLEATSNSIKDSATRTEVESLSDNDNVRCRDENGDSEELRESRSVLSSSPEVHFSRNEDSSTEANELPNHGSLSQISESTFRDENGESSGGRDFSDEFPSSGELALDLVERQKGGEFVKEVRNSPKHDYPESDLSPEVEINNHISPENDDTARIGSAVTNRDSHGELKSLEHNSSSGNVSHENESTGNDAHTSVGGSRVASRSPSKESLVSFYLMSSDSEHPDHLSTEVSRGHFGRYSSLDTSEISPASPTANFPKIESYYTNESSESSYDGIDDQINQRISQPSRKKVADIRTSAILRAKNGYHGNNKTASSELEWAPTSSSLHTNRTHHWNHGKPTETNRYATAGNRTRLDEPGPTGYRHSSLPPRPPYPVEPDNIDLLRTVCELKDQISRMHFPQVRRLPYDPFPLEGETYLDARRSMEYNQRPNLNQTCLHCCPQDWRYSVQLPPNSPCRVHTKRYASSEASLWGYETKPDKQRHKEDIIERVHLKEKYFARKRHVRPVAGGAPLVTCYRCSELLCLPSDFLLFRRKCHRLMCHACKEVLRFSLREGTHMVPYIRESPERTPLPLHGGAVESVKPLSGSSALKQSDRPVSCSDDYYNGNMSSGSSYQAVEDRKMKSILIEPANKIDESVGPSSRMPKWRKGKSEIVEMSSSPLHRLMGYSSPSQVLDK